MKKILVEPEYINPIKYKNKVCSDLEYELSVISRKIIKETRRTDKKLEKINLLVIFFDAVAPSRPPNYTPKEFLPGESRDMFTPKIPNLFTR